MLFSVCFSVKFAVCRDYANTRANLFIITNAEKINIKILPLQSGHRTILQDMNVAGRGVDHQLPSSATEINRAVVLFRHCAWYFMVLAEILEFQKFSFAWL